MKWTRYTKAIAAAVGAVLALIVAVVNNADPEQVPDMTTAIVAAVTTLLVYLLPNTEG